MNRIRISALQDTLGAAEYLLGKLLVINSEEGHFSGIITETEAYLWDDPASHSFCGITNRNKDMFLSAGHIYIYTVYGVHNCLNIVTAPAGKGEAVLIRSMKPVAGIKKMIRLRNTDDIRLLTRGPGRLTEAMGISRRYSGSRLFSGFCSVYDTGYNGFTIARSGRIGVSKGKDPRYRFYISSDMAFVSGMRKNTDITNI